MRLWVPALVLCLTSFAWAEPVRVGTKVGEMHPDFSLPDVEDKQVQLTAYRGKKVLLFHFASW